LRPEDEEEEEEAAGEMVVGLVPPDLVVEALEPVDDCVVADPVVPVAVPVADEAAEVVVAEPVVKVPVAAVPVADPVAPVPVPVADPVAPVPVPV